MVCGGQIFTLMLVGSAALAAEFFNINSDSINLTFHPKKHASFRSRTYLRDACSLPGSVDTPSEFHVTVHR